MKRNQKKLLIYAGILSAMIIYIIFSTLVFPLRYEKYIEMYSKEYDVPQKAIAILLCYENKFATTKYVKDSNNGLVQMDKASAEGVALRNNIKDFKYERDIVDVATSIEITAAYLKENKVSKDTTTRDLARKWSQRNSKEVSISEIVSTEKELDKIKSRYLIFHPIFTLFK